MDIDIGQNHPEQKTDVFEKFFKIERILFFALLKSKWIELWYINPQKKNKP